MRKWIAHWEIWLETVLAAILLLAIYLLFQHLGPLWAGILHFLGVIRPFLIGFAIAYILNIPARSLQKRFRKMGEKAANFLSVLLSYLFALGVVGLFLGVVLPVLALNLWDFATQLPQYADRVLFSLGGSQAVVDYFNEAVFDLVGNLSSLQDLFSSLGSGLTSTLGYARSMTSGVFDAFLGIVISIYMLLYKQQLLKFLDRAFGLCFRGKTYDGLKICFHQSNEIFYKFIVCKLIAGTLLGTLSGIVLSLLGVNYALMLALVIGLCNLVPYLGAICSFTLTVLISFFTGGPMMALLSGVFLLLLQQLDDTIIQPRLVGEALDLNPIMIIFAITVGGAYFGMAGMLLAVPMMAIAKVLVAKLTAKRTTAP
ncbi:MAG: AI-2E family transporter [Turicibacter sp.]|nr:AI-2E family transporter [Turicibacter sp.]